MLKNPQDRRAIRTTTLIKEVMLQYMQRKAIHEISVSDICKTCQINRATFYDHYRDVFDLAQAMEGDILMQLKELMVSSELEEIPADIISQRLFEFLQTHRVPLRLYLSGDRSWEFSRRLDCLIMPFFEKKVRQNYDIPEGRENELHTALRFAATGYYRFFMQAIVSDDPNSQNDSRLCAQLSDACLSSLFMKKEKTASLL